MPNEAHVRIDDGLKRGPRTQYNRPNAIDEHTGRILPLLSPEKRLEAVQNAAKRIENGERLVDIAKDIGVTKQALSLWLLDDIPEQYHLAQRRGLINKIIDADTALEVADNPLDLARAREQAKFTRWDAERRLSRLFGQKQEVTIVDNTDLGERLRRSRERVIEGESQRVVADNPNQHDAAVLPAQSLDVDQER